MNIRTDGKQSFDAHGNLSIINIFQDDTNNKRLNYRCVFLNP